MNTCSFKNILKHLLKNITFNTSFTPDTFKYTLVIFKCQRIELFVCFHSRMELSNETELELEFHSRIFQYHETLSFYQKVSLAQHLSKRTDDKRYFSDNYHSNVTYNKPLMCAQMHFVLFQQ